MDRIASTEFRRTFASRETQCVVTVNGHAIGLWVPYIHRRSLDSPHIEDEVRHLKAELASISFVPAKTGFDAIHKHQQAQRDAILHKINKGG